MRITVVNEAPLKPRASFVLYWMTAQRRVHFNFGLERAVELSNQLDKPLIVLEALRADYAWATARVHRFVIDGMADNRAAFEHAGVIYHPYVEPHGGAGRGLLAALADHACAVVTDEYPCLFLRGLPERVGPRMPVRVEAVDGCGLLPMRASPRVFTTAHSFRRHLQKTLAEHLEHMPSADPLNHLRAPRSKALPLGIEARWPAAAPSIFEGGPEFAQLPIDHDVVPAHLAGGASAARDQLRQFLPRLADYEKRNHPDADATSGLSPWLHFGHISVFEILLTLAEQENWSPDELPEVATGSRLGWWGMSPQAEGLLDQLVTWRELGFNMCFHRSDYDQFESLPAWAQKTLDDHVGDERPQVYRLEELEGAATHDALWNAAQTQLMRDGVMHNYLRMLWGKHILAWSRTPREALHHMIELNNRYALDGRDPNSYSGIFWVLGRYDRAWGPERPIFGKVRYMTSASARRKLRLKSYLARFEGSTTIAKRSSFVEICG